MVPDGLSGKMRAYRLACNLTTRKDQSRTRMGVKPREGSRAGTHLRIRGWAVSHSLGWCWLLAWPCVRRNGDRGPQRPKKAPSTFAGIGKSCCPENSR